MPLQPAVLGTARLNNFRLNYLTADQAADRATHVRILLDGVDVSTPASATRVLYKSVQIRDLVFDAPNTCSLTFYGAEPRVGQRLEVWINSADPILLFGGELQTVSRTYKGRPGTVIHPATAIDDTARANRKRPLLLFDNTSATLIAQTLILSYAPGYSYAGVELGLPNVTVAFDGSEAGMKGCLTQLAKLIGGYWYFEDRTLYLFVTPPGTAPDPIDDTPGRFLHDPPITWAIDKSQVRTRCYGKGASTRVTSSIEAGATLVPVEEATMFNPSGGRAITAIVPDGAAGRVLTYTGVVLGGGGGLVGPGASPSGGPGLTLLDGAGIDTGTHRYAYTYMTASGESLAGPASVITVGPLAPPAAPPIPGAVQSGGSVEPGTHYYTTTFVTASGETTAPAGSAGVTTHVDTTGAVAEISAPASTSPPITTAGRPGGAMTPANYVYRVEFVTSLGTTGWGHVGNIFGANLTTGGTAADIYGIPTGPANVTARRLYRTVANSVDTSNPAAFRLVTTIANNTATTYTDTLADAGLGGATIPTVNTTGRAGTPAPYQTVPLTNIAIGPGNVTARRLYRYSGAGPYKLLATIANNTATTYTDTTASASLGAVLPSANTATGNRVQVTLGIGGGGVTARRLYRSKANLDPLLFHSTIADNTTTGFLDLAADAALGAGPPASDTSGLVQPSGQVPAGATSIIVANTTPFASTGGWAVVGNGEQVIRYTGKTATALTGIPPISAGSLTASISYNSTITVSPMLVGVAGILELTLKGSPIHVWVQRDDLAAQAAMTALDGTGDGIYEHIVSDERRSEPSLIQICDAQLKLYSRPLVTVTYATRDLKTKSGKKVTITLASPAMNETLTIQDVAISELGIAPRLAPKFTVTASTVHHTFEAILQDLIRKADA